MPPVDDLEYILNLWHEAGTVGSSGMGIMRLSWQEIKAWLEVRDINEELPLAPWEIDLVRELSAEYAGEYSLASDKTREAPYTVGDIKEIDRSAIASKVKNVLSGFKKQKDAPKYEVED